MVGVFTVVLAIATIGLFSITAKGVRLARDEFNATHRPRIKILSMRTVADPHHPVAVSLTYVNSGDIDAKIVGVSHQFITVRPGEEPREYGMNDHPLTDTAKSGVPITVRIVSDVLQHDIARIAVKAGGFAADFQCVGYIKYDDAGGNERRTGFCFAMTKGEAWESRPNSEFAYEY